MKVVLLGLWVLWGSSCTTTEGTVEEMDNEIKTSGQIMDSKIGVNDDNQAIIQTETAADDELRIQQWNNNKKEDEVESEFLALKQCREDRADPRLGGSGDVRPIPAVDNLKMPSEIKEQIGIDSKDGQLKVVKKELYVKRLKQERRYEVTLNKMLKTLVQYKESCERKMRQARVKAGLPGQRYKAEGYYTADGTWVQTRKGENTLDDAFEIKAKIKKSSN